MLTAVYILVSLALLVLNGFFVLAEFAIIKVRPTRIEQLVGEGRRGAARVQAIQTHLDEYLSVCQVGITFASIGLGFMAEPAVVELIEPPLAGLGLGNPKLVHTTAFILAYGLVTYLHVLVGELLPKSMAIRAAERMALFCATPLRVFRILFYPPLWVLDRSSRLLFRVLRLPDHSHADAHSVDEVRLILGDLEEHGGVSFRRLLLLENVLDFGTLKVRDVARPKAEVKCLRTDMPWAEVAALLQSQRFSRWPLLVPGEDKPVGYVHVKDLFYAQLRGELDPANPDLRRFAKPCLLLKEDQPMEGTLSLMQDKPWPLSLVVNAAGEWTGILSMEDAQEEVLGAISEEFPFETHQTLAQASTPARMLLGVPGVSLREVLAHALAKAGTLPVPADKALDAVLEREKLMNTYLGQGVALPHARLDNLTEGILLIVRPAHPLPTRHPTERAKLLFVLLTPATTPRVHQRLQARVAALLLYSEYAVQRLLEAETPDEAHEVLRTAEQAVIDEVA